MHGISDNEAGIGGLRLRIQRRFLRDAYFKNWASVWAGLAGRLLNNVGWREFGLYIAITVQTDEYLAERVQPVYLDSVTSSSLIGAEDVLYCRERPGLFHEVTKL